MFNVKENMGRYLIGAVLGLLVGAALYFVQPVQWKGQALVKIGQISQNQNQNTYFIEPLETVIERLKSKSFIQAAAKGSSGNEVVELLSQEAQAGMSIKPIRNADALIITVIGEPIDLVRASIDAVVSEIVSKHNAILNTYKVDIQKELLLLGADINVLSRRIEKLTEDMSVTNGKFDELRGVVAGLSIIKFQADLDYKRNRSSQLRESISSANIRPTSLLEAISISERRMFSSLWRACLFGVLLGIFISVIWIRWGRR